MKKTDLYELFRKVPEEAKKPIAAGRLKGFTDINPMWRIKALTEVFGPCGLGWWYRITDKRLESSGAEVKAFVDIELFYVYEGQTSQPVVGTGGASFVSLEKTGPYVSDECFKMALTDAISVAAKSLGVGADVYYEKDRDKYTAASVPAPAADPAPAAPVDDIGGAFLVCRDCGKSITAAEHDFSVRKYKTPLCRECQKKR